jgi:hypothetical protein
LERVLFSWVLGIVALWEGEKTKVGFVKLVGWKEFCFLGFLGLLRYGKARKQKLELFSSEPSLK